jgi:hypothetical protein
MKTKFLLTFFFFLSIVSVAQNKNTEHLTFKGIQIDGTLNTFISKLKQIGFRHLKTENRIAMFEGDFAGYKNCGIGVSTLSNKDLVHKIVVIFPNKDTWSTLYGNYYDLKQMLTDKYGNPSIVFEEFESYPQPDNDDLKMYAVKFDKCKFKSVWETAKGEIQLKISHDDLMNCFVSLVYFDNINSEKIRSSSMDDL